MGIWDIWLVFTFSFFFPSRCIYTHPKYTDSQENILGNIRLMRFRRVVVKFSVQRKSDWVSGFWSATHWSEGGEFLPSELCWGILFRSKFILLFIFGRFTPSWCAGLLTLCSFASSPMLSSSEPRLRPKPKKIYNRKTNT